MPKRKIKVTIFGMGLIGGSLGQAWRKAGTAEVTGVVRRKEAVEEVLAVGAADKVVTDPALGMAEAEVVVFAPPVAQIVPLARQVWSLARPGTVFTDVGSVKGLICRTLWQEMPADMIFIGGHPMAGSERAGVKAADPYLFENAVYCLTPPKGMKEDHPALATLLHLVKSVGARALILDPDDHDLIVAGVSHVPHLAAVALVQSVAKAESGGVNMLQLAAGGFRDTTRVAGGAADIWRDICLHNRQAILTMLDKLMGELTNLRRAIAAGDGEALTILFEEARRVRSTIPARLRGVLGAVHEITFILADRPGTIHEATGLLAAEGINIVDIEIMRVREGEGGTLRLALADAEAAERAVKILTAHGYTARRLL